VSNGWFKLVWVGVVWDGVVHIRWRYLSFCQCRLQAIWGTPPPFHVQKQAEHPIETSFVHNDCDASGITCNVLLRRGEHMDPNCGCDCQCEGTQCRSSVCLIGPGLKIAWASTQSVRPVAALSDQSVPSFLSLGCTKSSAKHIQRTLHLGLPTLGRLAELPLLSTRAGGLRAGHQGVLG